MMKHLQRFLIALLVIVASFLAVPALRAAETSFQIIEGANKALDEFMTFSEESTDETYFAEFGNKSQSLESKLDDANAALTALQKPDNEKAAYEQLQGAITTMQTALQDARSAIDDNDEAAYTKAMTQFSSSLDDYNLAIDNLNKAAGGMTSNDAMAVYGGTAAGAAVLSAGAFAWAFYRPRGQQLAPELQAARRSVAWNSLWPLGGALVTLGTYTFSGDGTYFIAWGAVLFGAAAFVKSIYDYWVLSKIVKAAPPAAPAT